MPFYEYRLKSGSGCSHCHDGFDELQKIADEPLTHCPRCGGPVQRIISAPAVQSGSAHLSDPDHFSKKGFTQYKKVQKGVYEKTGGKGPRYISDDGK